MSKRTDLDRVLNHLYLAEELLRKHEYLDETDNGIRALSTAIGRLEDELYYIAMEEGAWDETEASSKRS